MKLQEWQKELIQLLYEDDPDAAARTVKYIEQLNEPIPSTWYAQTCHCVDDPTGTVIVARDCPYHNASTP